MAKGSAWLQDQPLDESSAPALPPFVVQGDASGNAAEPTEGRRVRDGVETLPGDDHDRSDEFVSVGHRSCPSEGEGAQPGFMGPEEQGEVLLARGLLHRCSSLHC